MLCKLQGSHAFPHIRQPKYPATLRVATGGCLLCIVAVCAGTQTCSLCTLRVQPYAAVQNAIKLVVRSLACSRRLWPARCSPSSPRLGPW